MSSSQRPLPDNTKHSQQVDIHAPVGFESAIPADERPQTYALDRAATGTGLVILDPGNNPTFPFDQWLGVLQSWYEPCGEILKTCPFGDQNSSSSVTHNLYTTHSFRS